MLAFLVEEHSFNGEAAGLHLPAPVAARDSEATEHAGL